MRWPAAVVGDVGALEAHPLVNSEIDGMGPTRIRIKHLNVAMRTRGNLAVRWNMA